MKNIFLLTIVSILLFGCSDDVSTNSPVIQGSVNNQFFRAPQASATLNADGSVELTGINDSRAITLQTASSDEGQYTLGADPLTEATFLTFDQELYIAGNGLGDGMIEITKNNGLELSGVFYFNAIGGEGDTLNFQKGVFFDVPITNGAPDEEPDGELFTAKINGADFSATIIQATATDGIINASGATETTTISLKFPDDITAGQYELTASGTYSANYIVNGVAETVATGSMEILSHNTTEKTVKGTFEFTTDVGSAVISNGAFQLSYE